MTKSTKLITEIEPTDDSIAALRNELLTVGWAMVNTSPYKKQIKNANSKRKTLQDFPFDAIQQFVHHIQHLLHSALPEEAFHFHAQELRHHNYCPQEQCWQSTTEHWINKGEFNYISNDPYEPDWWHTDHRYLRVILTCQGEGTLVMAGKQKRITPPGYALIFTGKDRQELKNIKATWHATPKKTENRILVVLTFDSDDPSEKLTAMLEEDRQIEEYLRQTNIAG